MNIDPNYPTQTRVVLCLFFASASQPRVSQYCTSEASVFALNDNSGTLHRAACSAIRARGSCLQSSGGFPYEAYSKCSGRACPGARLGRRRPGTGDYPKRAAAVQQQHAEHTSAERAEPAAGADAAAAAGQVGQGCEARDVPACEAAAEPQPS